MPTLDENRNHWRAYDWTGRGDEWSEVWGGTDVLWSGTLWPRLRAFLPTGLLVEIAPGYGRISSFLVGHCDRLIGIDLSEPCVEACAERFQNVSHASFRLTDGLTLTGIENGSVDLVVSFDSLVHADARVLAGYIGELARVLRPGAFAFLHHSNLAAFIDSVSGEPTIENRHWRDPTVSAASVRELARHAGLSCTLQEIVGWGGTELTDCFSLVVAAPERRDQQTRIVENPGFMDEAIRLADVARLYGTASGG